ncbi:MAG: tetratricopeptide repeat protein [Sandaracinaceae bacterium]
MKTYSLEKARADGWLEQLGEGSQGFAQLCEVVGTNFVAFSVIAGVRISALTVDPRNLDASVVEFEDLRGVQRMMLGEFRDRLAHDMLLDDEPLGDLPDGPLDAEALQAFVGFRYILLAPLYGISLEELRVDGSQAIIQARVDGTSSAMSLETLRELIRERVSSEVAQQRSPSPFSIDLNVVPRARAAAARGAHEEVSELLANWPGMLSLLLRTAEGQGLSGEVRATLAEALGLLGSAYVALGRQDWAQEVLRLGIQWAQDQLEVSADLFTRLADAHMAAGLYGQAIGPLRRALALGGPREVLLPALAKSFAARGRNIAALLCADEAVAAGASEDEVEAVREAAREALGEDWARFREHVAD